MSFTYLNELPTPAQIKERYPLSEELTILKRQRDQEIADVITGKDSRILCIIGPCSADNEAATRELLPSRIRKKPLIW